MGGIFIQVWKAIQKEGIWKSKDYTVKADPETVFLPMRLRAKLENQKLYGNQAWGEDLFAQKCMDMHGVDKIEGYDLMIDGNCEAHRPESEKKNKKWKPDCASTKTSGLHRFAKPQEYFECLKATQR